MMKRFRSAVPDPEAAEALGLRALLFMTEDETRLVRFLGDTGLAPAELRRRAGEAGMLAAVLEHLLASESDLLVFAAGAGIDPHEVETARALLAGERRRWEPSK